MLPCPFQTLELWLPYAAGGGDSVPQCRLAGKFADDRPEQRSAFFRTYSN
jgi:hypothetical protein